MALQIISMPLAFLLLFKPVFGKTVFYLRAFRSDNAAKELRLLIRAALGPSYRLSGIRPPSKRSSWWSRLLSTTATGLRYLQSNDFEMEASDHNWMARLLASYAKAPFVFIDVRDLTTHVEDEVRLSYLAMGSQRSIFIVDPTSTENAWREKIGVILAISPELRDGLKLISYPGDGSEDAADFVRKTFDRVQEVPPGFRTSRQPSISPECAFRTNDGRRL